MDSVVESLTTQAGQLRDVNVYLSRLTRLDSRALVRLRRMPERRVAIWSWTPLDVLALRGIEGELSLPDITVRADALLTQTRTALAAQSGVLKVELPASQDLWWRGPLPPSGEVLDVIPAAKVSALLDAAERTFREASAIAAIPQRAGEALLDHVALTVASGAQQAEVGVRQLIAAARLGFIDDADVRVGLAGATWIFLATRQGLIYRTITVPLFA